MAGAEQQSFADLLRRARRAAGLTQEALAERAGLSVHSVSNLERGAPHAPRDETVRLLARALALAPAGGAALLAAAHAARMHTGPDGPPPAPATGANVPLCAPLRAPVPPTPLVGREGLLARADETLRGGRARLLTLVGTGGAGKTHLALALARRAGDAFPGGVAFVALAPVRDARLVPAAIARPLGVAEGGARPLVETLAGALCERAPLLLLDNVEHLLPDAALVVAELLAACPELVVLATSRAPLHVRGEHELPVPPLALADPARLPPPDALARVPAIALLLERARAARPDLRLTPANAAAVAAICARLDGLPLALELAAPRLKVLPPEALLAQLGARRLAVLTDGARDLPERQRTLRRTLEWSYELLDDAARAVFRRLGVFVGGCTLVAAQAVCAPSASGEAGRADLLDSLALLVEHHLLQRMSDLSRGQGDGGQGDSSRFVMLETVREYAWERLVAHGELAGAQRAHATYFLEVAEAAEPHLRGPGQAEWLERLAAAYDELRAALDWALDRREIAVCLRLGAALWRYWSMRGHVGEGRLWLGRVLALVDPSERVAPSTTAGGASERTTLDDRALGGSVDGLRAAVLHGAAVLAYDQNDYAGSITLAERALRLRRGLGDRLGMAHSLNNLAVARDSLGEFAAAADLYEESLALKRTAGDMQGVASGLNNLAYLRLCLGDSAAALPLLEESLALWRGLDSSYHVAKVLANVGLAALHLGDHERAEALVRESLALRRDLGDAEGLASATHFLGHVALARGESARAITSYREALAGFLDLGATACILQCIEAIARSWVSAGRHGLAVELCAAAADRRAAMGIPIYPFERVAVDRAMESARAVLGTRDFAMSWTRGSRLALEDAVAMAQGG